MVFVEYLVEYTVAAKAGIIQETSKPNVTVKDAKILFERFIGSLLSVFKFSSNYPPVFHSLNFLDVQDFVGSSSKPLGKFNQYSGG